MENNNLNLFFEEFTEVQLDKLQLLKMFTVQKSRPIWL